MADIVELTTAPNVELLPGCVQNWHDLDEAPGASGLLRGLVAGRLAGAASAIVAGPHDLELIRTVVTAVPQVTVVVRCIVDSVTVADAFPDVRVLCGHGPVALAQAGTADVVIALDDVTRLGSLEMEPAPWRELFAAVTGAVAEGGALIAGVESELGLDALGGELPGATRNSDANATPLATRDASRPRSRAAFAAAVGERPGALWDAYGTWPSVTALARGLDAHAPLAALASTLVTSPVFAARSVALAGRLPEFASGWIFVGGAQNEPQILAEGHDGLLAYRPAGEASVVRTGGERPATFAVATNSSLFTRVVEACTDADLARVRALLGAWRAYLDAHASDGVLPAAFADARFDNVVATDAEPWAALKPAAAERDVDAAAWDAIADFYTRCRYEGVRLPWPATLHPRTLLETIAAAAGVTIPADTTAFVTDLPSERATRSQLLAQIQRLREENRAAWARFMWGEQRYAADRAIRTAKKAVTKGAGDAAKAVRFVRAKAGR